MALVVHTLHNKEILSAQPENLNEHASECKGSVDLFSKMQKLCLVFYSFLYDRNNCSINQREQIPRNPNESNDIECTSHNPQNTDQHSHPTQTAQLIPPQPPRPWNSPKPSQPAQLAEQEQLNTITTNTTTEPNWTAPQPLHMHVGCGSCEGCIGCAGCVGCAGCGCCVGSVGCGASRKW